MPSEAAFIHLGRTSPHGSSNLPGSRSRRSGLRGRATLDSPTRSCSAWGLPCPRRHRRGGALLPHPFTLTHGRPAGGLLSAALSLALPRPGVTRHAARRSPDFPRRPKIRPRTPASSCVARIAPMNSQPHRAPPISQRRRSERRGRNRRDARAEQPPGSDAELSHLLEQPGAGKTEPLGGRGLIAVARRQGASDQPLLEDVAGLGEVELGHASRSKPDRPWPASSTVFTAIPGDASACARENRHRRREGPVPVSSAAHRAQSRASPRRPSTLPLPRTALDRGDHRAEVTDGRGLAGIANHQHVVRSHRRNQEVSHRTR